MEYLTIPQAAELLQVKPRTIRQWIYDKKISAANVGGDNQGKRYRIPRTEVDRFINERMK